MASPEQPLRSQIVRKRKRWLEIIRRTSKSQIYRRKQRAPADFLRGTSLDTSDARVARKRGHGVFRSFVNDALNENFPEN